MMPFSAMRLRKSAAPATPLLDTYGSAMAAYSVRKLSTSYAGSCLRVVTSAAGNAETDIGFDGNGNLDETALAAAIGANTGTVKTWYDQSGNGLNLTQATLSKQPTIVSSGTIIKLNGRVAPLGNGTSHILASAFSATALSASRASTVSVVHKSTNTTQTGTLFGARRNTGYAYQSGHTLSRRTTSLSNYIGSGSLAAFSFTLFQGWNSPNSNISALTIAQVHENGPAGTQSMYVDGTLQTLTTVNGTMAITGYMNTATGNHGTCLFAEQDNAGTDGAWFAGNIGEAIFWATDRTTDRAGIKANQAAYWGTP